MPHIVQASSFVVVYLLHFSLQTTTTFCTFSLTLNFPNMKHLCFTQVIFDGEEEGTKIEYCFIYKVYSKSNHFCICTFSLDSKECILEIKSILHTYVFNLDCNWSEFSICLKDCQIPILSINANKFCQPELNRV